MTHQSIKEIKKPRLQFIELLRIISAFGIIAYHSKAPFQDFAYSGLIVFLILSPMIDTRFNWNRVRTGRVLARSLLVPWAFWMAVYGIINKLQHKPILPDGWQSFLYGTSPHLWFLPFMFVVLLIINTIKPRSPNILFWSCTLIAVAMLFSVSLWRPISLTWSPPLPQWISAIPPVLVGVVFGLSGKIGKYRVGALAAIATAMLVADTTFISGVTIPYTVGIVFTAIAAFYGARIMPQNWSVQPVSECMLGVYLCHILVLKIVGYVTGNGNYVTVFLTFLIALSGVWAARRFFGFSKLVLG